MGRVRNNWMGYWWMSKETGLRVGWIFPSRIAALKWKKQTFHTYVENDKLENHLLLHSPSRHIKETEIWNRHRQGWHDLILKRVRMIPC